MLGMALEFAIIGAIVFVVVKTMVFNSTIQQQALEQALMAAGIGVTVVCLIAWAMDLLGLTDLKPGWAKLLWGVLIASILANAALLFKRMTSEAAPHVEVACIAPLVVVKTDQPFAKRYDTNYKRGDSIAFFISMTNLAVDSSGAYSVDLRFSLEDPQYGRAQFLESHFAGNAEKLLTDPGRAKRREEYKAIAPECVPSGSVQSAQSMRFDTSSFPAGPGTYPLVVTVVDLNASTVSSKSLRVSFID
jgi:hypothetical protein